MAYRRDSQKAQEWRKWLLKNQAILDKCGLPEVILKDELSWLNFLMEGECWGNDGYHFHLTELPETQQQELYAFLEAELTADEKVYKTVYRQLHSRLNKTP
jgi:hypothetical protein